MQRYHNNMTVLAILNRDHFESHFRMNLLLSLPFATREPTTLQMHDKCPTQSAEVLALPLARPGLAKITGSTG